MKIAIIMADDQYRFASMFEFWCAACKDLPKQGVLIGCPFIEEVNRTIIRKP